MADCLTCPHPDSDVRIYRSRDRMTGEVFTVKECGKCELGWTEVAGNFDVGKYYPQAYFGRKNKRFIGVVEQLIRFFRNTRAVQLRRFVTSPAPCALDIGCGRGLMLAQLRANGWKVVGTESSLSASEYGREVLGLDIHISEELADCDFENHQFDAVTLWHVLEHQRHPFELLSEVRRILKPGGVVVVEVPNFGSWQAGIGKGRWLYNEAPRHMYHFSRKSVTDLFKREEWDLVHTRTLSFEFGPFGMIQGLLNRVSPEENCLFKLLGGWNSVLPPGVSRLERAVSVAMTVVFLVPCVVLGIVLEGLSVLAGSGGVVHVVAWKK